MFSPRGLLCGLNLEPNHARDEWKTGVHREACISAVKRQDDYQAVKRHSVRPMTPDPWSSVSKRNFEKEVRQWRLGNKALRAALYVEPMYIDVTFDAVDFDGGDFPWPSDLPSARCPALTRDLQIQRALWSFNLLAAAGSECSRSSCVCALRSLSFCPGLACIGLPTLPRRAS